MKHVPKYLMPKVATAPATVPGTEKTEEAVFVPFSKVRGRGRGRGRGGKFGGAAGRGGKKKNDPLRKFR
jgi:ATP-dependent RNA helicase DDX56/DBP9